MAAIYKSAAGQQAIESMYRAALDRWPVPRRELIVPTSHGHTFVVASGESNATPMVLLHGSGTNSAVWMRDVPHWSRQFRVYAVDLIGEPGLSAPSRPSLRGDAHAMWLDEVLDQLALERPALVGVSLGGWLALDYAIRRPARVASLSLLSPAGIGTQKRLFMLKAALLLMLGRWGLRRSFRAAAGRATPERATAFVTTIFEHFRPRMERIPILTDVELAALAMPVQVIVGAGDALIRANETRDRLRRLVPQARVTYLETAGHLLPPQTQAIAAFVMETSGARTPPESLRAQAASSLHGAHG